MEEDIPVLIDCHTHLDCYRDSEIDGVIERANNAGVRAIILAGTTLASSRRVVELSHTRKQLFAGVGIHPLDLTGNIDEQTYCQLDRLARSSEKVLVISEIGLDFNKDFPDRSIQYQAFREQIRLALETNLPVVFHARESSDEVLRVLKEEKAYEVGGAMHYFQGDEVTAKKAIDLGFYISIAKPILRLPDLQNVVSRIPLENIVLETDAAPQPFKTKRDKWTEPKDLELIVKKVAELQNRTIEETKHQVLQNIKQMLGYKWSVIERHTNICDSPSNRST